LAWTKPKLTIEARPRALIDADSGRLLPGTCQRDHQAGMGRLVERLIVCKRPKPW
jgi:hypothetical protein